ncbi:hypothetical protein Taro_010523 [Colocasia esculenta]|uniref:Uncharacterized protein n=1 Tax=Colocasia esculenta TaxID=4460 RepID=A0A843U3U0_COLES|nr:hypothetical protein [Colocasia esculenta]
MHKSRGYNRLVDHVGIHDQRRLTEALDKDSLVRRKEYPMESPKIEIATWSCKDRDGVVRSGRQNATGVQSRPECDRSTVATRPQNATYRAVAFTGGLGKMFFRTPSPRVVLLAPGSCSHVQQRKEHAKESYHDYNYHRSYCHPKATPMSK